MGDAPIGHGLEVDVLESYDKKDDVSKYASSDAMIDRVLILVAMEAEAMPLVEKLGLVKDEEQKHIPPPAQCVTFVSKCSKICLVYYGKCHNTGMCSVGTAPASMYTYLAIQAFKPDVVISAGTAGGFQSRGASIGDVFVATATVNHDRRIPIPGFDRYGVGKLATLTAPRMREALGLKAGVCSSGNSLDWVQEDMNLMQEHQASVKEMEAASVAWAASMWGTPLLCLKSITDIVDGEKPPQEEFLENLSKAAASLQRVVPLAIEYLMDKRLKDLY
jgi:5'-methylthioadenosine nucleosidase